MIKRFLLVLFALVFIGTIKAQFAEDLLIKVQNQFKQLQSFKADFTQTTILAENKNGGSFSGEFYYKKGNKYKIVLKSRNIISDGTTIWNYDEKLKRVVINSFSDEPSAFSIESFILEYPQKCKVKILAKNSFALTPKNYELNFEEAKIWVNSNLLPNRMEIKDRMGNIYKIILKNFARQTKLDNSFFSFEQSQNIKVIDLR